MAAISMRIGLFDDNDDGIVLMENFAEAVLRILKIDAKSVAFEKTNKHVEAERIASSGACDLIITDLMWPVAGVHEWKEGFNIADFAKRANPRTITVVVTSKAEQETDFREESRGRLVDLSLTWKEAFGAGKVAAANDVARHLELMSPSAVPRINSVERAASVGFVGLDTVAFSEQNDEIQLSIVKSFLCYMDEAWATVARPLVRPVFVFTGDGLLLGLVGDAGPRLALDLGISAWNSFTSLARYRTRMAIHAGPANVVTLASGVQQLLGHSVNWLFRAVNAAPDEGIVVTDEYMTSVLQGNREQPAGLRFTRRETTAKHARPLVIHDVERLT